MDFFTAGCRQREASSPSLLLQQYQCGPTQVVFACICGEENGGRAGAYMTERLLSWFRRVNLKTLTKSGEKGIETAKKALAGLLEEIDRELENGGMAGKGDTAFCVFLCSGAFYVMLHRGGGGIRLINRAFGRICMRKLKGEEGERGVCMGQGVMQWGVGLLLATESFYQCLPESVIKEGLAVGEIGQERQLEKRLKELVEEGERLGGRGIGAVMLCTISG